MHHAPTLPVALLLAVMLAASGRSAEPTEDLLRELPAGLFLKSSTEVPAAQTHAIGQRLGGAVARLTNSLIQVHGRLIQVNVVTAADEAQAKAVQAAIEQMKPYPLCLRTGRVVVEYVGKDIDAALALKTSYELGLVAKPDRVRYRVRAELATVETGDYMACNPLFNLFLAVRDGAEPGAVQQIQELAKRFKFGRSLVLRSPRLGTATDSYQFQPAATGAEDRPATVAYAFASLPNRHGVPYVTATLDITVDGTGLRPAAAAPSPALTAATPFWPVDDPRVRSLVRTITAGQATTGAKAMAILQWLTPGSNLRSAGPTGSRWGTVKVLEQKFGHCWDFSDCFVTLARAAGVPSRQVAGWFYGSSGHVWAEFYREGQGWQQVDPTGGGKLRCGIYHIPYFTSEDGEMPILYVALPRIETL